MGKGQVPFMYYQWSSGMLHKIVWFSITGKSSRENKIKIVF